MISIDREKGWVLSRSSCVVRTPLPSLWSKTRRRRCALLRRGCHPHLRMFHSHDDCLLYTQEQGQYTWPYTVESPISIKSMFLFLSSCLSFYIFRQKPTERKLENWRPPTVIWYSRSSICTTDLPAPRTVPFLHGNGLDRMGHVAYGHPGPAGA